MRSSARLASTATVIRSGRNSGTCMRTMSAPPLSDPGRLTSRHRQSTICSRRAATTRPMARAFLSFWRPRSRARVSDLLHSVGYLHHCAPEDGCAPSSHRMISNSVVQLWKGSVRGGKNARPNQRGWDPFKRHQSQFLIPRASSGQAMVGTSSSM